MRADFYCVLKDHLCKKAGVILADEKFCLSLRPSDTETYYQFLESQNIPYTKCVEREYNVLKFKESFLAKNDDNTFFVISFLDEKIHAEKGGIIDVLNEFIERLETFLFPIVSNLSEDAVFYISSDHGFIEKTGYYYKDTPRYSHGGDSSYERIIPLAKFRKI